VPRHRNAHAAAIAWGQIADIAEHLGDYDEAAALQQRRLEVNERLGDLDGIAAASWSLARIDFARDDVEAATPRLVAAFEIFDRLQRPDGIAVVGDALGQVLLAEGRTDAARQVLQVSRQAAAKLGDAELIQHLTALLRTVDA
jgi:tetratricopeptide (TPR) repeat protein